MSKRPSRPDAASIAVATTALEQCGYQVQPVPVSSQPTPDLVASCGMDLLTVEVKTNAPPALSMNGAGVAHVSTPLTYSNAVSRVIRKAARQTGAGSGYRVLCYVLQGIDAAAKADQVRATLYGMVDLIDASEPAQAIPCFYFDLAEVATDDAAL